MLLLLLFDLNAMDSEWNISPLYDLEWVPYEAEFVLQNVLTD